MADSKFESGDYRTRGFTMRVTEQEAALLEEAAWQERESKTGLLIKLLKAHCEKKGIEI